MARRAARSDLDPALLVLDFNQFLQFLPYFCDMASTDDISSSSYLLAVAYPAA
jgi:hypothetical protein